MTKSKKKKDVSEHTRLAVKINGFDTFVDSSINYEVQLPRFRNSGTRVYAFESRLELDGTCTYPKKRAGEKYRITMIGSEPNYRNFNLKLSECHTRDDNGSLKFRKTSKKEVPIYDLPKGIGFLDRERGTKIWTGLVWVPSHIVTDMLTLLPHVKPLYLEISEYREGRERWLNGLTLQTTDPEEE